MVKDLFNKNLIPITKKYIANKPNSLISFNKTDLASFLLRVINS